jgi:hypothetical protein
MAKEKTRVRIVAFLGIMGSLMIVFAFFAILGFVFVDAWSFRLFLFLIVLSLGVTEICVAWLMHKHLQ